MIDSISETSQRSDILRIAREDGTIDADGIPIAAEGGELTSEVELDVPIDLASAAVRRMIVHKRPEGIGIHLPGLRPGIGRLRGPFVPENTKPLGGVVDGIAAATTAGHGGQNDQDEEAMHRLPR